MSSLKYQKKKLYTLTVFSRLLVKAVFIHFLSFLNLIIFLIVLYNTHQYLFYIFKVSDSEGRDYDVKGVRDFFLFHLKRFNISSYAFLFNL